MCKQNNIWPPKGAKEFPKGQVAYNSKKLFLRKNKSIETTLVITNIRLVKTDLGNGTRFITKKGESFTKSESLKTIFGVLRKHGFIKITGGTLVNKKTISKKLKNEKECVTGILKTKKRKFCVKDVIPVGRPYQKSFEKFLNS